MIELTHQVLSVSTLPQAKGLRGQRLGSVYPVGNYSSIAQLPPSYGAFLKLKIRVQNFLNINSKFHKTSSSTLNMS